MEEVAVDTEEVAKSVAEAISALGVTVAWRFKGQEIGEFMENLGYALDGFGAILYGLTPTSHTGGNYRPTKGPCPPVRVGANPISRGASGLPLSRAARPNSLSAG